MGKGKRWGALAFFFGIWNFIVDFSRFIVDSHFISDFHEFISDFFVFISDFSPFISDSFISTNKHRPTLHSISPQTLPPSHQLASLPHPSRQQPEQRLQLRLEQRADRMVPG